MGKNNWLAALSAGASTLGEIKMNDTLDKRKRKRDKEDRLEIMQAKIDMQRDEVDRQNESQESARVMQGVKDRLSIVMADLNVKTNTPDQIKKLTADKEALVRMSTGLLTRSMSSSDVSGELGRMDYSSKEVINPNDLDVILSEQKGNLDLKDDLGNGIKLKEVIDLINLEKANDTEGVSKALGKLQAKLYSNRQHTEGITGKTSTAVKILKNMVKDKDLGGSKSFQFINDYIEKMEKIQGDKKILEDKYPSLLNSPSIKGGAPVPVSPIDTLRQFGNQNDGLPLGNMPELSEPMPVMPAGLSLQSPVDPNSPFGYSFLKEPQPAPIQLQSGMLNNPAMEKQFNGYPQLNLR